MAVDVRHDVPAVRVEPLRRVVGEPAVHFTVDRDAVVVVETDELAEPERAGQRAGFVRHAFHQAAVAEEHVGVVVDDFVPGSVERGGEQLLRQRHADGIGEALAEGAGRRLDAEVAVDLRVARRVRAELPEVREVLDRERVTRQVEQRIEQHRAVPVRQHEAVAVGPLGVARVVLEVVRPQDLRDVGHAHGHAGMTGIGLLDRIHAQRTDGVGELPACGHREPSWKSGHFSVRAGAGSHEICRDEGSPGLRKTGLDITPDGKGVKDHPTRSIICGCLSWEAHSCRPVICSPPNPSPKATRTRSPTRFRTRCSMP